MTANTLQNGNPRLQGALCSLEGDTGTNNPCVPIQTRDDAGRCLGPFLPGLPSKWNVAILTSRTPATEPHFLRQPQELFQSRNHSLSQTHMPLLLAPSLLPPVGPLRTQHRCLFLGSLPEFCAHTPCSDARVVLNSVTSDILLRVEFRSSPLTPTAILLPFPSVKMRVFLVTYPL